MSSGSFSVHYARRISLLRPLLGRWHKKTFYKKKFKKNQKIKGKNNNKK